MIVFPPHPGLSSIIGRFRPAILLKTGGVLNEGTSTDMAAGMPRFAKILQGSTNGSLSYPDIFCQAAD
jgi:hypothetical protein